MGRYEERLKKVVDETGFKRLFHGKCKNCGERIWSVGEQIDIDTGTIKAMFICNCGAKYKQVVYSREKKGGYKYEQGLVTDMKIKGKSVRIIRAQSGLYRVTANGVKVKKGNKNDIK